MRLSPEPKLPLSWVTRAMSHQTVMLFMSSRQRPQDHGLELGQQIRRLGDCSPIHWLFFSSHTSLSLFVFFIKKEIPWASFPLIFNLKSIESLASSLRMIPPFRNSVKTLIICFDHRQRVYNLGIPIWESTLEYYKLQSHHDLPQKVSQCAAPIWTIYWMTIARIKLTDC